MEVHIKDSYIGERVDVVVSEILKDKNLSRNIIQKHIKKGCMLNGKKCKRSHHLKVGDVLHLDDDYWDRLFKDIDLSDDIVAQEGALDIRYENDNLIVLYKPKGLVVHPGVGNPQGTLANYLRYYLESKDEYDNLLDRAGIVHRLDKGVSGLMVTAKNKRAQESLKNQFKERSVIKIYRAGLEESTNIEQNVEIEKYIEEMNIEIEPWQEWQKVTGYIGRNPKDRYKMEFKRYHFLGSKEAITYMFFFNNELLLKIETGRMHQIRATLAYLGYHIKGDKLYGKVKAGRGIMLEAIILSFIDMKGERLTFKV